HTHTHKAKLSFCSQEREDELMELLDRLSFNDNTHSTEQPYTPPSQLGDEAPSQDQIQNTEDAMEFFSLICEIDAMLDGGMYAKSSEEALIKKLQTLLQNPAVAALVGGSKAQDQVNQLANAINGQDARAALQICGSLENGIGEFFAGSDSTIEYILSHMNSGNIPDFSDASKNFLGSIAMIAFVLALKPGASQTNTLLYQKFFHNEDTTMGEGVLNEMLKEQFDRDLGDLGDLGYTFFVAGVNKMAKEAPADLQNLANSLNPSGAEDPSNDPFNYEEARRAAQNVAAAEEGSGTVDNNTSGEGVGACGYSGSLCTCPSPSSNQESGVESDERTDEGNTASDAKALLEFFARLQALRKEVAPKERTTFSQSIEFETKSRIESAREV
ncbi:MAG: hypothetical protein AAGF04_02765, partial [Chlamydiota bacterium]